MGKKPKDIFPSEGIRLIDWKSIEIPKTDFVLYYNSLSKEGNEKRIGFNFYCIEKLAFDEQGISNCECLFRGTAYFDGIRHLYFGDEQTKNYGYLYYPNLEELMLAIKELRNLEKRFCWDCE